MSATTRPLRVLIAKPGLDGHDVGAKVVCRALIDAGMEVIYTGLRQSPEAIAETALQEDVDVVGVSILSGAHLPLSTEVVAELEKRDLGEVLVVAGGNIPKKDHAAMAAIGVDGVFPTGTPFEAIVEFVNREVKR